MPFVSQAQARYMFANHPKIAKEFASHTKNMKGLPQHKKRYSKDVVKMAKGMK